MAEIHQILDCFEKLGRELDDLNRFTEAEFLAVGERLQAISKRTREVAASSSGAAGMLDGQEFTESVDRLRLILAGIGGVERGTDAGRETLAQMLRRLKDSRKQLSGFVRLVMKLKILALHTRIESARVRGCDTDFDSLGDEVSSLALQINQNCEEILEGAQSVEQLVAKTLSRVDQLGASQKRQTAALARDVTEGLDALTKNHADCAEAAASIGARYEAVCRRVGDVVRSLQFQDITRQQLEHVKEALDEVGASLRSSRDGAVASARLAARTAALQAAQLANSRRTLIDAVSGIVRALNSIESDVGHISALPARLAGRAGEEGVSALDTMRARLSAIATDLALCAQLAAGVRDAIRQVAPELEKMSGHAGEIEAIGFHLARVALNAQVKTAQIGEAGAALGVLAGSIQELTVDTTASTGAVAGHLRALASEAHSLGAATPGQTAGADAGELSELAAELDRRMAHISELDGVVAGELSVIAERGDELRGSLAETCAMMHSQERAGSVLGQALADLEAVVETLGEHLPDGYDPLAAEGLEEQSRRYTMHSERQVHELLNGAGSEPPAAPELVAEGREPAGDDLGDNVELF